MTDQDYRSIIAREWINKSEMAFTDAEILFREKRLIGDAAPNSFAH